MAKITKTFTVGNLGQKTKQNKLSLLLTLAKISQETQKLSLLVTLAKSGQEKPKLSLLVTLAIYGQEKTKLPLHCWQPCT